MFENIPDWLDWKLIGLLYTVFKDLWTWHRARVAKRKADQRKNEQSADSDRQSRS